jgi:hypothetical protein
MIIHLTKNGGLIQSWEHSDSTEMNYARRITNILQLILSEFRKFATVLTIEFVKE